MLDIQMFELQIEIYLSDDFQDNSADDIYCFLNKKFVVVFSNQLYYESNV